MLNNKQNEEEMSEATKIITELKEDGFDNEQIISAMQDGEYLAKEEIDQETAEEVNNQLQTVNYFGRINDNGDVVVLYVEDGAPACTLELEKTIYSVDGMSVAYDHPNGVIITKDDAELIGLEIE